MVCMTMFRLLYFLKHAHGEVVLPQYSTRFFGKPVSPKLAGI